MTEDLLHFIWKFKLLRPIPLCTTDNLPVRIIHPGEHNTHSGPDFSNGRLRIGDTEWAGNIEIHRLASEWNRHNHQCDTAYDNVILHVVLTHDKDVFNSRNQPVPCLELKNYLEPGILERYEALYKNRQEIPCGSGFSQCKETVRASWLERILIERLEGKTAFIKELFEFTGKNWEETFYLLLCKSFGFKINSEPFLQLGRRTPLNLLLRYADNPLQLESLLFGQAGLLEAEFEEAWPNALKKEYAFLKHKHSLEPMSAVQWKFLRLRPGNFPTIRIAQLAAFIREHSQAFRDIIAGNTIEEIRDLFRVEASDWWKNHYTFKELSPGGVKKPGSDSIDSMVINTVLPLLFFYGKERDDEKHCEKALDWYSSLAPENNHITRHYEELGFTCQNAAHSQSLLELHAGYCKKRKCLSCGIGMALLQPEELTSA